MDLTPGLDEPIKRSRWRSCRPSAGSVVALPSGEAAGPVGCGAEVSVPFAGRAGAGSQPLGAREQQQFAALELNFRHPTSVWTLEAEM